MIPWTPQPSFALSTDLRLLVAAPEVQALVFRLGHVAQGGRIPFTGTAEGAVVAACGGAAWAGPALTLALADGFVRIEEGALVLEWEWPAVAEARASARPSARPPEQETPLFDGASARASDERSASKRLAAIWARYRVTAPEARRAWIDSDAGQRFLAREGRDRAWVEARVTGENLGRFGARRGDNRDGDNTAVVTVVVGDNSNRVVGDNYGDNTPPPPAPLSPEKNKKSPDLTGARGDNKPQADGDSRGGVVTAHTSDATPRCPTRERVSPPGVAAREVLMFVGAGGSAGHEAELQRLIDGAAVAWTRESAQRLGRHVRDGHLRDGWRPTLQQLRGRDGQWTQAFSLHEEAKQCARCSATQRGAQKRASDRVVAIPAPAETIGVEELRAARARVNANTGANTGANSSQEVPRG